MIFGRFLTGTQIGGTLTLNTIYMSEISSAKNRKVYTALIIFASDFFMFLIYFFGSFLSFRWLATIALENTNIQSIMLICCPQSPIWLLSLGCKERARKILISLNGKDFDADQKMERMHDLAQSSKENPIFGMFQWVILKPILVACALQFFKGFSGQPILYSYSASLLIGTGLNVHLFTLPYPIFMTIGVISSALLTKLVSRKKILICTTAMQGLVNFSFFLYFLITRSIKHCPDPFSSIECALLSLWPVFNLFTYSLNYGLGWGTIAWSMFADTFNPKYKQVSAGLVTFWYTIVVTTGVFIFPNFVTYFGFWPIFLLFAINCLAAIFFEAICF